MSQQPTAQDPHRPGQAQVVVAGIGNTLRRDDGAGPVVAERVAATLPNLAPCPVSSAIALREPLDLLGWWDGADLAIVVDAASSGAAPGTVTLTWAEELDVAGQPPSTHGLSVLEVYRLAASLGDAPERLALVGIEGGDFSHGEGFSEPVGAALDRALELVLDIAAHAGPPVDGFSSSPAGGTGRQLPLTS
ncbi:MAG: hydrogenase maturation protease [Acidimicrobiales bacterium]